MFKGEDKYKTIGVHREISEELQAIMWNVIERLVNSDTEVDYLQVFKIKKCTRHRNCQLILHKQELPGYRRSIHVISENRKIRATIFVISSHDYEGNECSTMMLSREY